jgi:DNA-binding beta-propeller fold protein YncE
VSVTMPVGAGSGPVSTAGEARDVAYSPDGRRVAVVTDEGASTWILADGRWQEERSLRSPATNGGEGARPHLTRIAFSPDGRQVAGGEEDGTVHVWAAATGQLLRRLSHGDWVTGLAFGPGGARLATAGEDGFVRVWDAGTGHRILEMEHGHRINAVAFSQDGRRLATVGRRSARVWNAQSGLELRRLDHPRTVWDVAFSPDGRYLVTAARDRAVRVWDADSGERTTLVRHGRSLWGRSVKRVVFSPDGRSLASAGCDKTARLWNAATGEQLLEVGHEGPVDGVAFSPDGRHLITSSPELRMWEATAGGGARSHVGVRTTSAGEWLADAAGILGAAVVGLGIAAIAIFALFVLLVDLFGPWIVDDVVRDPDGAIVEAGVLDQGVQDEIRVGDCLVEQVPWMTRWIVAWMEDWWGDPIVGVPCSEPHDLEVFAVAALPDGLEVPAPGDEIIEADAEALCDARFAEYVGGGIASSELTYVFWSPTVGSWDDGDRRVECWLTSSDGSQLEGSMQHRDR